MANDSETLHRLRQATDLEPNLSERKMFGGHCFMVSGNMAFGLTGSEDLMVRVGPNAYEEALSQPHSRKMDFTGRPMKGFVYVEQAGFEDEEALHAWLERGLSFARGLPPKQKKPKKK